MLMVIYKKGFKSPFYIEKGINH